MKGRKDFTINSISIVIVLVLSFFIGIAIYHFTSGISVGELSRIFAYGAVGSKHCLTETLVLAIPLMFAGLGIAFAFKCGLWNIGAEGQLYAGAIGATFAALNFTAPAPLHMLLIVIFAFLAGGAWAAIAGVLKAKLGVNEILTTIMMNYIAMWLVHYLVNGPWWDRSLTRPQTSYFPTSAWLPIIVPDSRLHAGLLIALACAIITYVVFKYTRLGFNIKVIGANPKSAHYGGISVPRMIIITMFISGGLAGLAGMGEVCGLHHYLIDAQYSISPGYGYYSIGVALLGGLHAWGTVLASFFFSAFINGASYLKGMTGMHAESVFAIVGIVLLAVLSKEILIQRLKRLPILRGRD